MLSKEKIIYEYTRIENEGTYYDMVDIASVIIEKYQHKFTGNSFIELVSFVLDTVRDYVKSTYQKETTNKNNDRFDYAMKKI
jgi:hypothetical protein